MTDDNCHYMPIIMHRLVSVLESELVEFSTLYLVSKLNNGKEVSVYLHAI